MKYSVKNFRVFGNDGVTLDLAPITILTGCNSSGKSSIAKSLLLLDSYFTNGRIDFTKRPYSLLGDFDKVLNRNSKDGMITIEYSTYSIAYDGEITVRLKFGRDEKDDLHNAFLQEICFLDSDGYIIYQSLCGKDGYYMDRACMEGLKERFFNFLSRRRNLNFLSHAYGGDSLYKSSWLSASSELINEIQKLRQGNGNVAIKKARELQSLYVLNIFDWLNDCTCENIEKAIYSHVNSEAVSQKVSASIKMLVEDFRKSQCDTFIKYFDKKESERKFYKEENKYEEPLSPHDSVTLRTSFDVEYELPSPFNVPDNIVNELLTKELTLSDIESKCRNSSYCSFEQVFSLLMRLEKLTCTESYNPYIHSYSHSQLVPDIDTFHEVLWEEESSRMLKVFDLYLNQILKEGIDPDFKGISYVTSSRADVQRMYTLEENNDLALLLRQYFELKRKFKPQEDPSYCLDSSDLGAEKYNEPNTFINKWLNQFEVAHHISIKKAEEGGVYIYLYSDENDEKGELLADKGYGITQLISILLQIEITIMNSKWVVPGNNLRVGRHKQVIIIEEPEIHLHPSYQSLLADMFLEAYQKYNIHFIIETHSEYLIRKTQVFVAQKQYQTLEELGKENPFKVYYFSKQEGAYEVLYNTNGCFSNEFGVGFFDEAENLVFKIM